jgi:hypothetical protein
VESAVLPIPPVEPPVEVKEEVSGWDAMDESELTKDDLDLLSFFKERSRDQASADEVPLIFFSKFVVTQSNSFYLD